MRTACGRTPPSTAPRRLAAVLALVCLLAAWQARAQDTATFMTHDYPPYYSEAALDGLGPDGAGHGFVLDVVAAAYRAVGVEARFVFEPVLRSMHTVTRQGFAGLVGCGPVLRAMEGGEVFESVPISRFRTLFHYFRSHFAGRGVPRCRTLEDLHGYRVTNILGGTTKERLETAGIIAQPTPHLDQGLRMLRSGRVDFWVATGMAARFMVGRDMPEMLPDLAHLDFVLFEGTNDVNFDRRRPDYARLKEQLEKGLRIIRDDGTYLRILESYFGRGEVPAYLFPPGWDGPTRSPAH